MGLKRAARHRSQVLAGASLLVVGVAVLAMDLARQESMVEDKRVLLFSLVFSFLEASGMMLLARGLPRKAATGEDGELRL